MTTVAIITDGNLFAPKTSPKPTVSPTTHITATDLTNIRARLAEHALAINANEPKAGTWTPVFSGHNANLTFTPIGTALWTRNGNVLRADFQVEIGLVSPGAYSTSFTVSGLPATLGSGGLPTVTSGWAQGSVGAPYPGLFPISASGTQVAFNGGSTDVAQILNASMTCLVVA